MKKYLILLILLPILFAAKYIGPADIYSLNVITTPSSPDSGFKVYAKSDGVYALNSSGTEIQMNQNAQPLAVTSKTTTYTATTSDQVILNDTSSAAYTLTLYTAVGNTGRELFIKKTDSSSNLLTIDGNASETIDGDTTFVLDSQYDEISIVSDGTNWIIKSLKLHGYEESKQTTITTSFGITAGTWGDLTSLSLCKGVWIISARINYYNNGTTTTTGVNTAVSATSGNDITGLEFGNNRLFSHVDNTNGYGNPVGFSELKVEPSATTTYYLKGSATTSITNLTAAYFISARRVR